MRLHCIPLHSAALVIWDPTLMTTPPPHGLHPQMAGCYLFHTPSHMLLLCMGPLQCARSCAKPSVQTASFNPHSEPVKSQAQRG